MVEVGEKDGAVTLKLRVQPRASRSEIAGEYNGALKLRICSPPVDGKANDECRRLIARLVGVPASSVEIVVGDSSRDKVIRIGGISAERVRAALRR